jgi:hypothetical protein
VLSLAAADKAGLAHYHPMPKWRVLAQSGHNLIEWVAGSSITEATSFPIIRCYKPLLAHQLQPAEVQLRPAMGDL